MKTLSTILLISVIGVCKGQDVRIKQVDTIYPTLDFRIPDNTGCVAYSDIAKLQGLDTVQVIMQVSDTSRRYHVDYYVDNVTNVLRKDTVYLSYGHAISWVIGYSVREKYCCINGNMSNLAYYQPVPYYTHLYYLGEDKKPLPKNMYVWMSTQLK